MLQKNFATYGCCHPFFLIYCKTMFYLFYQSDSHGDTIYESSRPFFLFNTNVENLDNEAKESR